MLRQATLQALRRHSSDSIRYRKSSRRFCTKEPEYDLVVIGGGSGGLACSKQAAKHGKRVALLDYVHPSPQGSTWGLGGTCVNVGCIPKKLMHQASLHGSNIKDATDFGWQKVDSPSHDWSTMVQSIQGYIKSINWGYRSQLMQENVKYLNAYGSFIDANTLKTVDKKGQETTITAKNFVVATGGRPSFPDIEGVEHCISSDDVFALKEAPGKTLVVGASYVALECAGFLRGLGYDVTVMVRSILLRGFDQQIAEMIGETMKDEGTEFIRPATPTKIIKKDNGKLVVHWKSGEETKTDEYDTVLFATGRTPETSKIGLDAAGVSRMPNGKLNVTDEQTNVSNIYALGDITQNDAGELTPVAIQAGRLLADRLFNKGNKKMDYKKVPTTVFTPIEYGCVGMSEEEAIKEHGEDNIEVYHAFFKPLEWAISPERPENRCYVKVICDLKDNERILGFHILSPSAGEITQGFALGIKLGATKSDFDDLVGIHPTIAEELTGLDITKRSGEDPQKTAC